MSEQRNHHEVVKRDLASFDTSDLVYKKTKLMEVFLNDPDLMDVLGKKQPRIPIAYKDPDNPTDEEISQNQQITEYNERITHEQIVPWIKLNGIQDEVLNFIMFDLTDERLDYDNQGMKQQILTVMCLVKESDMYSQYGIEIDEYDFEKSGEDAKGTTMYMIPRTDLLSAIVKDLLTWTNALGSQLRCASDEPKIIDTGYYARELHFVIKVPNTTPKHSVHHNHYDDISERL